MGKPIIQHIKTVCQGDTFHAEAVRVFYNKEIITYDQLLDLFFEIHDPTTLNSKDQILGHNIDQQYFIKMISKAF